MITTLLFAATMFQTATTQPVTPTQQLTAPELISKMLAKYSEAKTIVADITLTAQDTAGAATLTTNLQLDRTANHLLIRQQKLSGQKQQWLAIVDGTQFQYDLPANAPGWVPGKRMAEPMGPHNIVHTYQDAYATAASGLGDRSTPLDILIARKDDLRYVTNQWSQLKLEGKAKIDDRDVNVITGLYSMESKGQDAGNFEIDITDSGELVRYVLKLKIDVPGRGPQPLAMTWITKIDLATPPNPAVFVIQK